MASSLPKTADIVVVGGGVIGTSIAYHLSKIWKREVLLLEKTQLTHGCTWHAAGLLGQLRSSYNLTKMLQHSVELYKSLAAETGHAVEWKETGSLRLACSKPRWIEIKRQQSMAKSFGLVETHLVSPKEALDLCPILDLKGVEGAAWIPSDGHIDPTSLTNALAAGARAAGTKILQGVEVIGCETQHRRITTLHTKNNGSIKVGTVVNCGGLWARELGLLLGVRVPTINVEHQYCVTEKIPNLPKNLPSIRDPDYRLYYKPEVNGLAIGGWEADTIPRFVPNNFGPELYNPNFDRFAQLAEAAGDRTPIVNSVGIKKLINGPIPVSADGEPILGKAPERDNVFVAAGFTAGVGQGGGAGRLMAEWIVNGVPSMDVWPLDIRRFGDIHNTLQFLRPRTVEAYGSYYSLHTPGKELLTARPARTSPIYTTLKEKGAIMGNKFGWERPNWFSLEGDPKEEVSSFDRPNWFEAVRREHNCVREKVALIDQSSFAKLEVHGPRAFESLQRIAANDLSGPPGSLVYTQLCNDKGGIEADVTIARLTSDRFYVITGSGFGTRDFDWIYKNLPKTSSGYLSDVEMNEVTNQFAVINLTGPSSRKVLEEVEVEEKIDNISFPFMTWKLIHIGSAPVRALRITYTGELGWELHVPVEYASEVYEKLWSAGQKYGIMNAGYRCIDSLRLEKGFRVWGAELTPETNPLEAGLGFCVKLDKKGGFIGQEALTKIKKDGVRRKLGCFTIQNKDLGTSDGLTLQGKEAIIANGKVVGATTSGGYGYTLDCSIAYGYVPTSIIDNSATKEFQIEAYGRLVRATRQDPVFKPLYDPQRLKCLQ